MLARFLRLRPFPLAARLGIAQSLSTEKALGLALAAVIAFALTSRWFELFGVTLKRLEWFLALLAGIALFAVPARLLVRRHGIAWAGESRRTKWIAAVACFLAGFVNQFAVYGLADVENNVWIFPRAGWWVLSRLLVAADAALHGVLLGLCLTAFMRLWRAAGGSPAGPGAVRPAPRLSIVVPLAVALPIINALVFSFHARERSVPYWDFGYYWTCSAELAAEWHVHPENARRMIAESLRINDYNLLPAILPAIAVSAFGDTWIVYVAAVANLYGAAIVLACGWAVRRLAGRPLSPWANLWPALLVATFPILWGPTLRGYLDLGGVALALAAFGLYLARPAREITWPQAVLLGALLGGLFLFRRWFSFAIVSFILIAGAEAAIHFLRCLAARQSLREAFAEMRPLAGAGVVAGFWVVSLALPLLLRIAGTNYADDYSAYKVDGSFYFRTRSFFNEIGFAYPIAFAIAAIAVIADRRTRRVGLYAVAIAVLSHIQFHRIQDLGIHHRMLYAPSFLLLAGLAGVRIIDALSGAARPAMLLALAAISAFGFLLTLEPELSNLHQVLRPLTPNSPYKPLVRNDLADLSALAGRLDEEATRRNTSFVVLASSVDFNQTYLFNLHRALGLPRPVPWRQKWLAEVDKANGFPAAIFDCGVVAVAEPTQYHLWPSEQQNVAIPAEMLVKGEVLGAAFRRLPERFSLQNGIQVSIFVRSRPFEPGEVEAFLERLRMAHPNNPNVYRPKSPPPLWPASCRP